jgi:hypothetical protein
MDKWYKMQSALGKNYEELPETSEAMICTSMIHLMVRRLARKPQPTAV